MVRSAVRDRRDLPVAGGGDVVGLVGVVQDHQLVAMLPERGLGLAVDARIVERDRGATPPHLYELTAREELFHGVQALRLNPVGGGGIFGRDGLLAHPYMLGPNGDSNGCVSFKNYDAFLQAFQNGVVKRLVVVASRG